MVLLPVFINSSLCVCVGLGVEMSLRTFIYFHVTDGIIYLLIENLGNVIRHKHENSPISLNLLLL